MDDNKFIKVSDYKKALFEVSKNYNNLIKVLIQEIELYSKLNAVEVNKIKYLSVSNLNMYLRSLNKLMQDKLAIDIALYKDSTNGDVNE